mmetsp:Transcript_1088/g.4196  ORF Transcript_1088/g.4196 Transcript_1088/m.4196 type:complete len:260 (+) Transcript_1088:2059-2838(+)
MVSGVALQVRRHAPRRWHSNGGRETGPLPERPAKRGSSSLRRVRGRGRCPRPLDQVGLHLHPRRGSGEHHLVLHVRSEEATEGKQVARCLALARGLPSPPLSHGRAHAPSAGMVALPKAGQVFIAPPSGAPGERLGLVFPLAAWTRPAACLLATYAGSPGCLGSVIRPRVADGGLSGSWDGGRSRSGACRSHGVSLKMRSGARLQRRLGPRKQRRGSGATSIGVRGSAFSSRAGAKRAAGWACARALGQRRAELASASN